MTDQLSNSETICLMVKVAHQKLRRRKRKVVGSWCRRCLDCSAEDLWSSNDNTLAADPVTTQHIN